MFDRTEQNNVFIDAVVYAMFTHKHSNEILKTYQIHEEHKLILVRKYEI